MVAPPASAQAQACASPPAEGAAFTRCIAGATQKRREQARRTCPPALASSLHPTQNSAAAPTATHPPNHARPAMPANHARPPAAPCCPLQAAAPARLPAAPPRSAACRALRGRPPRAARAAGPAEVVHAAAACAREGSARAWAAVRLAVAAAAAQAEPELWDFECSTGFSRPGEQFCSGSPAPKRACSSLGDPTRPHRPTARHACVPLLPVPGTGSAACPARPPPPQHLAAVRRWQARQAPHLKTKDAGRALLGGEGCRLLCMWPMQARPLTCHSHQAVTCGALIVLLLARQPLPGPSARVRCKVGHSAFHSCSMFFFICKRTHRGLQPSSRCCYGCYGLTRKLRTAGTLSDGLFLCVDVTDLLSQSPCTIQQILTQV